MKVIYIAHPVSGNVDGNITKILKIVRLLNLSNPDIVPFAPYVTDLLALDDKDAAERERGIKNNTALFINGAIDEVWLYGDRISSGMKAEIELAKSCNIPVVSKTDGTCHF